MSGNLENVQVFSNFDEKKQNESNLLFIKFALIRFYHNSICIFLSSLVMGDGDSNKEVN